MPAFFSTMALSPVRTDCERNRSSAAVSRISAGIRSPAARRTLSPTTSSSEETLCHAPPLRTSTVEETISVRWSAMRLARSSWTKRTMTLSSSMHTMVTDVVMLRLKLDANTTSVINERMASTDRMTVKGLMNALLNR